MSWWLWVAYCALCAGIFLYPSRFNLAVAQQATTRGLLTGIASALGAALGVSIAMTLASLAVILVIMYTGPISDFLGWLGISWLILMALWTFGTLPYRTALADNDNSPAAGRLPTFCDSLAQHLLSARFIAFFLALLMQFSIASNYITILDFINLQIATFITAFLCYALIALYPNILIGWLRSIGQKIALRRPRNKTLISGKSVKARYRQIAA